MKENRSKIKEINKKNDYLNKHKAKGKAEESKLMPAKSSIVFFHFHSFLCFFLNTNIHIHMHTHLQLLTFTHIQIQINNNVVVGKIRGQQSRRSWWPEQSQPHRPQLCRLCRSPCKQCRCWRRQNHSGSHCM
jgi:hypothetical protein